MQEKVVFSDGKIYILSASWVADPRITAMKTETLTPPIYHVWQIQERRTSTEDDSNVSVKDLTEESDDENVVRESSQKGSIEAGKKTLKEKVMPHLVARLSQVIQRH